MFSLTFAPVKRVASIGLILLMSLQCFYKLGVITYFQLNRDYIAEVLCINRDKPITLCNGQCFLEKNLDLADGTTSDDGAVPVAKQNIDLPIFLITENLYSFHGIKQLEQRNSRYLFNTSSPHHTVPFHPPAHLS